MKRILSFCVLFAVLLSLLSGCKREGGLTVLDANGQPVENEAYVQIVEKELAAIQPGKDTVGYTVYTAYDADVAEALKNACMVIGTELDAGCAVTNLKGNLVAVYSTDEGVNYATQADSPYSSFKPLSVYAPAIEQELINWSSSYTDSAYKQIEGEDGELRDWPANSTGTYTGKKTSIYEAIRKSVNTVAVKCLADVGVNESLKFLKERLGITLGTEEYAAMVYGEEEVLGNVALGYVTTGLSPVDMAGYYQIFANGGKYEAPKAILKLCDGEGTVVYERAYSPSQVISPTTAGIMNKLLQGVVSGGGTGEEAAVKGVQVAGKTGTGDENSGNWFVGVTPGYSLAVWHGSAPNNCAPEIFGYAVEAIYQNQPDANTNFVTYANLKELVCCSESGMAVSGKCTRIEKGYFAEDDVPDICDRHG